MRFGPKKYLVGLFSLLVVGALIFTSVEVILLQRKLDRISAQLNTLSGSSASHSTKTKPGKKKKPAAPTGSYLRHA